MRRAFSITSLYKLLLQIHASDNETYTTNNNTRIYKELLHPTCLSQAGVELMRNAVLLVDSPSGLSSLISSSRLDCLSATKD